MAGSLVLAVWQRTQGVSGLVQLGLTYGDRVRQAPGGQLRAFGGARLLAVRFIGLRAAYLPVPDPPARQIYQRVRRRLGAGEVAGTSPGVVDNLYLSWLFQYGIVLGAGICLIWLGALLWPMLARFAPRSLLLTTRLWGVFLVTAAVAVEVWEKFPVDLVAALVFAQAFAHRSAGADS